MSPDPYFPERYTKTMGFIIQKITSNSRLLFCTIALGLLCGLFSSCSHRSEFTFFKKEAKLYADDSDTFVKYYFHERIQSYDDFYGENARTWPYGFWELDKVWEDSTGEMRLVVEATLISFLKFHIKYGANRGAVPGYFFGKNDERDPVSGLLMRPEECEIKLVTASKDGNRAKYKVTYGFRMLDKYCLFDGSNRIRIVDVIKINGKWKLLNVADVYDKKSTISQLVKHKQLYDDSYEWAELNQFKLYACSKSDSGNREILRALERVRKKLEAIPKPL